MRENAFVLVFAIRPPSLTLRRDVFFWDAFLKDIAPTLKSAELIADSKRRQGCLGTLSDCFQNSCKESIGPEGTEASYDLCLTRPLAMVHNCKVEMDECGIPTNPPQAAESHEIWGFVVAKLASLRVDSCTKAVKQCLQSDDRCGEDYTKCVGLDTDTIVRMCPYDKLVGCQQRYAGKDISGNAIYEELQRLVQGIFLNIDNNFLALCRNAADEAMLKVCGDLEECTQVAIDPNIGSNSLAFNICGFSKTGNTVTVDATGCRQSVSQISDKVIEGNQENLAAVLGGMIYWGSVDIDDDGNLTPADKYFAALGVTDTDTDEAKRIKEEFNRLQKSIDNVARQVEADPTVQFCMTGREVQGMKSEAKGAKADRQKIGEKSEDAARFPNLTQQMRLTIATGVLKSATSLYEKKFEELMPKMSEASEEMTKKAISLSKEITDHGRKEAGRTVCARLLSALVSAPANSRPYKDIAGPNSQIFTSATGALVMPILGPNSGLNILTQDQGKPTELSWSKIIEGGLAFYWPRNRWRKTFDASYNWDNRSCNLVTKIQYCSKGRVGYKVGKDGCEEWGSEKDFSDVTYQF